MYLLFRLIADATREAMDIKRKLMSTTGESPKNSSANIFATDNLVDILMSINKHLFNQKQSNGVSPAGKTNKSLPAASGGMWANAISKKDASVVTKATTSIPTTPLKESANSVPTTPVMMNTNLQTPTISTSTPSNSNNPIISREIMKLKDDLFREVLYVVFVYMYLGSIQLYINIYRSSSMYYFMRNMRIYWSALLNKMLNCLYTRKS